MLNNLYHSWVIKTLLWGPFMCFPWGTLDPAITAWPFGALFKFHPSWNDPSRVTEAIITVDVKWCIRSVHILRYRSNMKINEEKTQFGVHDPYCSYCSLTSVVKFIVGFMSSRCVSDLSLFNSDNIIFK